MFKTLANELSRMPIRVLGWITLGWALLVAAVLVWQIYSYTGLFQWLAEWQFLHFDRMFPIGTMALVTGILCAPLLFLISSRLRRRRKLYGRPTARAILSRDRALSRTFAGLGIGFAIGALVLTAIGFSVGGFAEKPSVNLTPGTKDTPIDGRITARGWLHSDRIGLYREQVLFFGRDLYVAPLTGVENELGIRYFVEVPGRETSEARQVEQAGIVRARAMPGGLETLYENAGYTVDRPTYVVFTDLDSARWPYFNSAANLAIFALIMALAYGLMRWNLRKVTASRPDDIA